jgi:hypothetical protein
MHRNIEILRKVGWKSAALTCVLTLGAAVLLTNEGSTQQQNLVRRQPEPVTVTNTPLPVTVTNQPANDEGSREAALFNINVSFGGGGGACNSTNLITVPTGKRLVIQNISAYGFLPSGVSLLYAALGPTADPSTLTVVVPVLLLANVPGAPATTAGIVGQQTHIYVDSDQHACLAANTPNNSGGTVFVSGYYVVKP